MALQFVGHVLDPNSRWIKRWTDTSELQTRYVRNVFANTVKWPRTGHRLFLVTGNQTNGEWLLERTAGILNLGPSGDRVYDGVVTTLSNFGKYIDEGYSANSPLIQRLMARASTGNAFSDATLHSVGQQIVPLNHFQIHNDATVIAWIEGILANPKASVQSLSFPAAKNGAISLVPEGSLVSSAKSFSAQGGALTTSSDAGQAGLLSGQTSAELQLVDLRSDTLVAGSTLSHTVPVDSTSRLLISCSSGGAPGFRLIRPDGQTIAPGGSDPSVVYDAASGTDGMQASYEITSPLVGQWQVILDGTALASDEPFSLRIEVASDLRLAAAHEEWINSGIEIAFTASLGRSGEGVVAIPGATMTAKIRLPGGSVLDRPFSDLGTQGDGGANDGIFGLIQGDLVQPGEHEIVITLNGTDTGQAFRRTWRSAFTVAAPGGFVAGEPNWQTVDADDNGIVDALMVDVLVSVAEPGDYVLSARLRDGEQNAEILAVTDFHREAGSAVKATLHFNPRELPQGQTFGPFELRDLKLFKRNSNSTVFLDRYANAVTVPVTLYNEFSRSIRLTGDLNFGTVPVGQQSSRDLTIHNDGWESLDVASLSLPFGFSAVYAGIIEAGEAAVIPVTFSPQSETTYSGSGSAVSNAAAGECTILLSGQGGAEQVALTDWLTRKGVPANQQGATDDPSHRGLPNIFAYLFNVHPLNGPASGDQNAIPRGGLHNNGINDFLTLRYRKNRNAVGLNVAVETSATLQANSWRTVIPDETVTVGTDSNTGDPVIEVRIKMGAGSKMFGRLKVGEQAP